LIILFQILLIAVLAILVARFAPEPWRGRLLNVLKAFVTVWAFWLLLSHPVTMEDGSQKVAGVLVLETLSNIDATTFWTFCALAAGVKFVGILASMYRWTVLLRGQMIELPFRHIFGSFLIGRFIGTFLPSTAGLDGYKLFDAARFSGRTVEVTAATALEKVIGVSGIFITFLVAAPFGIRIFGDNAGLVAMIAIPLSLGIIGGLMLVLFFPGLVQWILTHLPIPGKARLEGLVLRISNAAAAYRDKKGLIVQAFGLSFIVHFTTAAMYFFTALAIGAAQAEFWPVVFGSSIQILATVISPFTIAGEGIREAAQYLLLKNMIGPANSIVSAALGFWAAEALTLAGGVFWWIRPRNYRPSYCLVNGQQVDFDEAARAALELETEEERAAREAAPANEAPPLGVRARLSAGVGFGAGAIGGLVIGAIEAFVIAQGGFGGEAQVLWYGPLAYAAFLGGLGLLGGAVLAILPMDTDEIRGWTPSLALIATFIPFGLAITLFRLRRDVYLEQMPPAPVLLGVLGAAGALALLVFFAGPRLFRGPAGRPFRPLTALGVMAVVTASGAVLAATVGGEEQPAATAGAPPAHLAGKPNLILVMVDTLRADHLSCYGDSAAVETPNLCRIASDGGSLFDGFAHASWTKPSTATLVTSLLPSSHGAMSKPAALSDELTLLAEVVKDHGYATGGIVTNTNLAESFGFDQGYDEYHYLAPDYLFGAGESSSKLILYQIARRVYFRVKPGLRVGDFYQSAETVNDVAFDFLERRKDGPFFLFLHYMDPHDPYFEHPWNGRGIDRATNQHPDPSLAEEMHRLYRGEIEYLDEHFGKLIAKLEELGVYDDTVIALVSDHGEEFHEHGGWWHGMTLYEEQIRVPLLVKWQKGRQNAPADARSHVVGLLDVAPTLIARAGASAPPEMQGVDLALPHARRPEPNRMVFAEEDHEGNVLRAVRTETWKYIEANEGNPRGLPTAELFDIVQDRDETNNVLASQSQLVAEMRRHADAQEQKARSNATAGGEAKLSDAEREALCQLGYMECD
jgi:arylsulfatase A-like enzyme/uncharacterized membrane protein YbhN (UPF0104 family)